MPKAKWVGCADCAGLGCAACKNKGGALVPIPEPTPWLSLETAKTVGGYAYAKTNHDTSTCPVCIQHHKMVAAGYVPNDEAVELSWKDETLEFMAESTTELIHIDKQVVFSAIYAPPPSFASFVSGGSIAKQPDDVGSELLDGLTALFPALNEVVLCPEAECTERMQLSRVIVHLNDGHRWTREQIADWLESLDLDISSKPLPSPEDIAARLEGVRDPMVIAPSLEEGHRKACWLAGLLPDLFTRKPRVISGDSRLRGAIRGVFNGTPIVVTGRDRLSAAMLDELARIAALGLTRVLYL